jgi:hypothetical protein
MLQPVRHAKAAIVAIAVAAILLIGAFLLALFDREIV